MSENYTKSIPEEFKRKDLKNELLEIIPIEKYHLLENSELFIDLNKENRSLGER